jgi:hypothetical protein
MPAPGDARGVPSRPPESRLHFSRVALPRWRLLLLVATVVLMTVPATTVAADVRAEVAEIAEAGVDDDELSRTPRVSTLGRAPRRATLPPGHLEPPAHSLARVFRPPRGSSA